MTRNIERRMVEVNGISMEMALAEALLGKEKVMDYFDRQRTELVDQIEDLETQKMEALNRFEDRSKITSAPKKHSTTPSRLAGLRSISNLT